MLRLAIPMLRLASAVRPETFICEQVGSGRRLAYRVDPARSLPAKVRDRALLRVSSCPGDGLDGSAVRLPVDDVGALFAELGGKRVTLGLEPVDRSWGNREMRLRDPDGNTLRFTREGLAQ
jgi:catechol 2,3-dioxygenase-like lactoylglutathione lyase family enzyme